jgi:hypothetical protein
MRHWLFSWRRQHWQDDLSQQLHYPCHADRRRPLGAWWIGGGCARRASILVGGEGGRRRQPQIIVKWATCPKMRGSTCPYLRTCAFVSWGAQQTHQKTCQPTKDTIQKNVPHCSFVYLCICAPAKAGIIFRPVDRGIALFQKYSCNFFSILVSLFFLYLHSPIQTKSASLLDRAIDG